MHSLTVSHGFIMCSGHTHPSVVSSPFSAPSSHQASISFSHHLSLSLLWDPLGLMGVELSTRVLITHQLWVSHWRRWLPPYCQPWTDDSFPEQGRASWVLSIHDWIFTGSVYMWVHECQDHWSCFEFQLHCRFLMSVPHIPKPLPLL